MAFDIIPLLYPADQSQFYPQTHANAVLGLDTHLSDWIAGNGPVIYKAVEALVPEVSGPAGKSAYELAVAAGYTGTQAEWLASLKGADGAQGVAGKDGARGDTGATGDKGADGVQGPKGDTGATGLAGKDGAAGATGAVGKTGATGAPGAAGKDAVSIIIDGGSSTTNGRAVNSPPSYYQTTYPAKQVMEFKQTASVAVTLDAGQASTYGILTTRVPGTNTGFGRPRQSFEPTLSTRPLTYVRIGTSDTAWSAWETVTTW